MNWIPDPSELPDELRAAARWVRWKNEQEPGNPKGRKIPLSPISRFPAKSTDSSTWGSFETALAHAGEAPSVGLGFVLGRNGSRGYVGIDLDHVRDAETGELAAEAVEIIRRAGTYAEVSPSRTGVKLFGVLPVESAPVLPRNKADLDDGGEIEVYARDRYFTVTGQRLPESPRELSDLSDVLKWLIVRYLARQAANVRQTSGKWMQTDATGCTHGGSTVQAPGSPAPGDVLHRAEAYLAKIPGAISGQRGQDQTWSAALSIVRGFGLSADQAFDLLGRSYNPRCEPPWSDRELLHKVEDAWKNGRLPFGYLLEKGVQTVDAPPPPAADPVLIGDALEEPAPDIAWLIQDLLPVQAILLLAAHGGLGKTTILVQLFACLAAGRDFIGFHVPQPVPVLYLIAEGARHVFLDRVRVALARLGMDPKTLPLWVTPREFTPEIGATIEAYIEKTGARLVALDTVGLFHDGDENSASDFKAKVVKPLRAIMTKRDVSFVLVSHEGKPSQERKGRHRVRGTSAMVDDSDVAARLEAPDGDRATTRVLIFEKVRTAAAPEPIALEFLPSFAVFERVGEEEIRERQEERTAETDARRLKDLEAQVVRYLRRDPDGLTKAELTAELHPRRADLVKVLDKLRDESRAFPDRDPKGRAMRWRLAITPRLEVAG